MIELTLKQEEKLVLQCVTFSSHTAGITKLLFSKMIDSVWFRTTNFSLFLNTFHNLNEVLQSMQAFLFVYSKKIVFNLYLALFAFLFFPSV